MASFFPRWSNLLPLKVAACAGAVALGVGAGVTYYATPKTLAVGYQPAQPIPFSHKIHADQVGLDCRHCHGFVEVAGHANVPGSNTCWNCHRHVQPASPKLQPLRDRFAPGHPESGRPLCWVRVHKLPDYVQFNHSAHVNRGVSCHSCHGPVDQMDTVYQAEPLSMGWCLACHRAPEDHLRPLEQVYEMKYTVEGFLAAHPVAGADGAPLASQRDLGLMLKRQWNVTPSTSCTTCHH